MFSQVILSYMTNIEAGTSKVNKCKLLTHLPLEILPKTRLKLVKQFSGHCRAIKSQNLP